MIEPLTKTEIAAWDKVLNKVRAAAAKLSSDYGGPLYRGHTSRSHILLPSLLRTECGADNEGDIYQMFRTRAGKRISSSLTSWEVLSIMQHNGVPTRLLDWTEVFGIALYFALLNDKPNPCIWMLDGFRLTKRSVEREMIFTLGIDKLPDYYTSFVEKENWPYSHPIAVSASWGHERLSAQKGYFTVHGNLEDPLEKIAAQYVERIDIPIEASAGAREFLLLSGIDHYSVFPDFVGLSQWIKTEYCGRDLTPPAKHVLP